MFGCVCQPSINEHDADDDDDDDAFVLNQVIYTVSQKNGPPVNFR